MSHIIEIDTAKQAAIYIEKMHDRKRFFITKDSDEHYPPGAWLSNRIAQFVARFKLPSFSRLGEQYVDVLLDKGFDYRAVHTAYDAACKKHNISTSLLEWLESRRHDPNQPSNWPDNYYQGNGFSSDVHLLEGVKAIRVGRWIEALTNVVDESGRHVSVLVRFIGDDDRTWIEHVIELDHLSSDGSAMFQALEECGYRISGERKARAALRQLIQGANIGDNDPVIRYSRPGWHGDVHVLPTGVTSTGVKAFVAGGVGSTPGGTYDEWCEHVRDQVWQGDTPQFAVGMLSGLAGIVSSRLACDHPVIYFSGETGSGKSTSQIVGGGVVADPNEGKGTLFGVSDQIDIHRGLGSTLHIDDPTKRPSFASAKKIESLIYSLHERTASTFSSVLTLERIIERAKGTMSEGVRRRVLTIDTGTIERIDIGRAMAIKSAARRFYGHAAPIFAQHVGSVDDLYTRVRECTALFVGDTNDPELYGIAWIAGILLSAAQIAEGCELVPDGASEQIYPFLQDAVAEWTARRHEGSGLAVIEGLVSEARPLGECLEGQVWTGQDRDGDGAGRVLYVRTDRLDRGQVRQIKAAGKLLELNHNNVAHNYLPRPDGRFVRHYRVRCMGAAPAMA